MGSQQNEGLSMKTAPPLSTPLKPPTHYDRKMVGIVAFSTCVVGLLVTSCSAQTSSDAAALEAGAIPIEVHECAACGMVVREQPAPRAQLLHRDGTRRFFCSIGDMVQYAGGPSPHGRIEHVFVETLPSEVSTTTRSFEPHPWRHADQAHYVTGIERPGVMGPPVLVFASSNDAAQTAKRLNGRVVTWSELEQAITEPSPAVSPRHVHTVHVKNP
jgi:copper chaperone NosL